MNPLTDDGGRFETFEPIPPASDLAGFGLNWPTAITLSILLVCVTVIVLAIITTQAKARRQQAGIDANSFTRRTPYGAATPTATRRD